jgi:hypothetical protein
MGKRRYVAPVAGLLSGLAFVGARAERQELVIRARHVVSLDQAVREPSVVQHPSGVIFVAGYSRDPGEAADPPNLYRSADAGTTWSPVDVGRVEDGAIGNSDVDLEVGPDGSLYFLTMGFDRSVGEGTSVALGISRDVGTTWTWRAISRHRFDDRPWIGISPVTGRVHVVWNDGSGVRHSVSDDRGETWTERPRISQGGGSSHFAIGPGGVIAVRIAPGSASGSKVEPGADFIAVSRDDGISWQTLPAPGTRDWSAVRRWVEPIGWGPNGELYSLWSEGSDMRLGRSMDAGATWNVITLVRADDALYYPMLTAGPGAVLAASWFSGAGPALRANIALIDAGAWPPRVSKAEPQEVDAWRLANGVRVRDPAGEYFPVTFLKDGDLAAALPVQDAEGRNGFTWIRLRR